LSSLIILGVHMQFPSVTSSVMKNCIQLLWVCLANFTENVILHHNSINLNVANDAKTVSNRSQWLKLSLLAIFLSFDS
jgi:hypothetical protein